MRITSSPNRESSGGFGRSVAGSEDATGDGRGDYAVGAPLEEPTGAPDDSGRVYAFSGESGALVRSYLPTNPQTAAWFGWAIEAVPSLDAGGKPELAIGSPNQDVSDTPQSGSGLGIVEVFSFGSGTYHAVLSQTSGSVVDGNQFGFSIAVLPNESGPGLSGILVGAPGLERAYLFGITQLGQTPALEDLFSTPDTTGTDQFWGGAVANAGDANGDGRDDFVIGGRGSDGAPAGPANAGRAYLYRRVFNDGCSGPANQPPALQNGSNAGTTLGATLSSNLPSCSAWTGNLGPDTWYRYTATCSGTVTFSTCGGFDTLLAVYDGCSYPFFVCNLSALLGCNDNVTGCLGFNSRVTVNAVAGDCFFVRLGGFNTATGATTLTVSCQSCPADLNRDGAVNAADLSAVLGGWGTAAGDVNDDGTTNATDISVLLGSWGACQ